MALHVHFPAQTQCTTGGFRCLADESPFLEGEPGRRAANARGSRRLGRTHRAVGTDSQGARGERASHSFLASTRGRASVASPKSEGASGPRSAAEIPSFSAERDARQREAGRTIPCTAGRAAAARRSGFTAARSSLSRPLRGEAGRPRTRPAPSPLSFGVLAAASPETRGRAGTSSRPPL